MPWPNRQPLSANRFHPRSSQLQRPTFAEARIAERLHGVAEALGDRHEQAVVRLLLELDRPAGLEAEATADEHPGDILERVAVALAEFIRNYVSYSYMFVRRLVFVSVCCCFVRLVCRVV